MNWKKVAIERLRDYKNRECACSIIPEQLVMLRDDFTSIRSTRTDATAVRTGNGNKREDALIENIVKREELKKNLRIAKREVDITHKALKQLTDEEYKILDRFYISRIPGHVERLCEELCIERTRVYELKDEALKKFTLAAYGIVEI